MELEKTCNKCRQTKPITEFAIAKKNKNYFNPTCKECIYTKARAMHALNKAKNSQRRKELYQNKKAAGLINYDKYRAYSQKYKASPDFKSKNRAYKKKAWKANWLDPIFRLRFSVSNSIGRSLRNRGSSKQGASCLKKLGYTIQELKSKLEAQFEPWMGWHNRGHYNPKTWNDNDQSTWTWQIDHIIPHSTFQYTSMDDESFRQCWALTNLRPLAAKQNILDGALRIRHLD